jgi:hypothetical protein
MYMSHGFEQGEILIKDLMLESLQPIYLMQVIQTLCTIAQIQGAKKAQSRLHFY